MYPRHPGDPWRVGTPNGTQAFVSPDWRPALAASDGVVIYADGSRRGGTVIIDHAGGLTTYYTHLEWLLVNDEERVSAGTPIGVIGADPLDSQHVKHLHFELWRDFEREHVNPEPFMKRWEYLPDPGDHFGGRVPDNGQPRNGGHRVTDGVAYSVPIVPYRRRSPGGRRRSVDVEAHDRRPPRR